MSTCEKLRKGQDNTCISMPKRYYQQAVLVNREDVRNRLILVGETLPDDSYIFRHRVLFDLHQNKTGYRFTANENCEEIFGKFDKTETNSIPQYSHSVNVVLSGVDEDLKCIIKQLDYGDYFAALQYYDGTVEIFGFEYGLSTTNYGYDPHNNDGGGVLTLKSLSESLEDEPPLIYSGDPSDFDNNFADVIFNPDGDFNDDFNDDFNNQDNN